MTRFGIVEHDTNAAHGRTAVTMIWSFGKKEGEFERNDIMDFVKRLRLPMDPFDHVFSGYPITLYVENDNHQLSFFYSDLSNEIFVSVICKDAASRSELAEALKPLRS